MFDGRKYLTNDIIGHCKLFDREHYFKEDIFWKRTLINGDDCCDQAYCLAKEVVEQIKLLAMKVNDKIENNIELYTNKI